MGLFTVASEQRRMDRLRAGQEHHDTTGDEESPPPYAASKESHHDDFEDLLGSHHSPEPLTATTTGTPSTPLVTEAKGFEEHPVVTTPTPSPRPTDLPPAQGVHV